MRDYVLPDYTHIKRGYVRPQAETTGRAKGNEQVTLIGSSAATVCIWSEAVDIWTPVNQLKFLNFFTLLSVSWYWIELAPCSLSFYGSGSRSGSSWKWIISALFPIIYSRKLCIHWHDKCCFRPKMDKIKVHVWDNKPYSSWSCYLVGTMFQNGRNYKIYLFFHKKSLEFQEVLFGVCN